MSNASNKFSKEKEREILEMYNSGLDQVQIANHFNTFNTSIRRVLLRNGISPITYSERHRLVEPTFFNDWKNPNIQYWLGVIASDGCITKGALVVETTDKEWMEDYRDFVNPSININTTLPKKGKLLHRVAFKSKGMTEELEKYGIVQQKSLILDWKYPITFHFLRGVIDGDGWVSTATRKNQINVGICSGSLQFLEKIGNFLKSYDIEFTIIDDKNKNRKNPLYILKIHKHDSKVKLYHLLYENAQYFLKRKKDNFDTIVSSNYDYNGSKAYKKTKVSKDEQEFFFKSSAEASRFLGIDSRSFGSKMSQGLNIFDGYKCEYI